MDNIINLVEQCCIDITNDNDIYNIDINYEITIDLGLSTCIDCHNVIDAFGNCLCC